MDKSKKRPIKEQESAEKPVSLFGARFEEVVGALLKTKKPKEEEKKINGREKA